MRQFLLGAGAALLAAAGGVFLWSGTASVKTPVAAVSPGTAVTPYAPEPLSDPPAAGARTREEKRFDRYDKDRNAAIARDEYLAARRKAFAKLDTNGDGRLAFEEYAVKTSERFAKADADRSGTLSRAEFATTRVVRKAPARRPNCPPATARDDDDAAERGG